MALSEIPADEVAPRHSRRLGREVVMQYLFSCDLTKEMPTAATFDRCFELICDESGLSANRLTRRAREFAVELYTQVTLHREEIDEMISSRCNENWAWDRLSPVDRNIMRVAVAEMLYFEEIPPVVSIDEAVEIARDFSGGEGGNFINGILNAIKDTLHRDPRGGEKAHQSN